jgi:hypothetical protein
MSSFPGGCRFVEGAGVTTGLGVISLGSVFTSFAVFFCGVVSAAAWFFLLPLVRIGSFAGTSGVAFFSSSFCDCFFCTGPSSFVFRVAPVVVGVLAVFVLLIVLVGVSGGCFTGMAANGVVSVCCFVFLALGVAARIGVTGITGTAGVIVEDVVRDIGREPGRDLDSSITARGMAGIENPGGIVGVVRRACEKK